MNELFNIEPTKSPRMKWMERHHLRVVQSIESAIDARFSAIHGMTTVAHGATEYDALCNAAKKLNIRLWNEEGMR